MPVVALRAVGRRGQLKIWINDYDTHDGTCVCDYVPVVGPVKDHIRTLDHLTTPQCAAVNLGTWQGHSILQVV